MIVAALPFTLTFALCLLTCFSGSAPLCLSGESFLRLDFRASLAEIMEWYRGKVWISAGPAMPRVGYKPQSRPGGAFFAFAPHVEVTLLNGEAGNIVPGISFQPKNFLT